MSARATIDALHRARPRSRLLRLSLVALASMCVYAWTCGDIAVDDLFSARRAQNLERFLGTEIVPHALRETPFTWSGYAHWAGRILDERGIDGALATLSISTVAIVLAAALAFCAMLFSARNVATSRPFESGGARGPHETAWRVASGAVRAFLVLLRSIPEYVWAYLLLAMLGANAWPAVLALAIHNSGILGKLGAEGIENLDPAAPRALRGLGASRAQIALAALWPAFLSRFLLYFFYRFETCVREATVLGMLGVVSLGYWIQDARSKQFYDEMVLLVLVGALIVLAADLVSALVRALLRRTS